MIKKAIKRTQYFLNTRPLCTISTALSLKDAAFGLGFILGPWEITQTLIYQNISMLLPGFVFGWVLLLIASVTVVFALALKTKYARLGLEFMALFWLFAVITYLLGSAPMLAVVALVFSFIPGYISYLYKTERKRPHGLKRKHRVSG